MWFRAAEPTTPVAPVRMRRMLVGFWGNMCFQKDKNEKVRKKEMGPFIAVMLMLMLMVLTGGKESCGMSEKRVWALSSFVFVLTSPSHFLPVFSSRSACLFTLDFGPLSDPLP